MTTGSVTSGMNGRITTQILRGAPLRDALLEQVTAAVANLGRVRMCIVQVGNHAASTTYIRHKLAAFSKVGIVAEVVKLRAEDGEQVLHETLRALARDADVHAIIVQTPLPEGWQVQAALDLVPAAKDIDGLSEPGMALRRAGDARALLPATPLGVMRLLEHAGVDVVELKIAVIGKGMVAGAPLREMLAAAGAEVVGIDKDTRHPARLVRECPVVITAAGVPGLVTDDWLQPGAVVIDVGITRREGKLLGDVDAARVEGIARIVTPVPGGVGPMTVASILTNICDAACLQLGRPRVAWVIDVAPAA